jgi:hypothetical protein
VTSSTRVWQKEQVAKGNCQQCGQPREPERAKRVLCVACARKATEGMKRRYHQLIKMGRCSYCGKKREPDREAKTHCAACAERERARYVARREKLRALRKEKGPAA